jgi:hypothetical protein
MMTTTTAAAMMAAGLVDAGADVDDVGGGFAITTMSDFSPTPLSTTTITNQSLPVPQQPQQRQLAPYRSPKEIAIQRILDVLSVATLYGNCGGIVMGEAVEFLTDSCSTYPTVDLVTPNFQNFVFMAVQFGAVVWDTYQHNTIWRIAENRYRNLHGPYTLRILYNTQTPGCRTMDEFARFTLLSSAYPTLQGSAVFISDVTGDLTCACVPHLSAEQCVVALNPLAMTVTNQYTDMLIDLISRRPNFAAPNLYLRKDNRRLAKRVQRLGFRFLSVSEGPYVFNPTMLKCAKLIVAELQNTQQTRMLLS